MGGTVPGMYTTVEGMLAYYLRRLEENPMAEDTGDSRSMEVFERFQAVINKLRMVRWLAVWLCVCGCVHARVSTVCLTTGAYCA